MNRVQEGESAMVRKMSEQQRRRLEGMSMIGRKISFADKREPHHRWEPGVVVDEVYIMVSEHKHVIQKIKFLPGESWDGSRFAYRTGYWTYDKDMRRIKWGQFSQFLSEKDYRQLLKRAKEKKWKLFS
jgi:hypothetical protein